MFSERLKEYIEQAGLPLRRVASQSGIPHQTLYNWLKGTRPRWHAALPEDLERLGMVLGLSRDESGLLLKQAGCSSARAGLFHMKENPMETTYRMPKGWFASGDAPEKYDMGVDPAVTYQGQACITIKARAEPTDFAALAQMIKAGAYSGKRLRFSAAIRSENLENRAALFMRVSGSDGKILAFDNMRNRPVTGTNDWAQHAIVLDVDKEAEDIIFGILMAEKGQAWMADVHLETVDREVPTTDLLAEIAPFFPVNLGFDE